MSVALLTLLTLVASGPEHEAPPPAPAAEAARSVHPDVVLRGADAQPVLQTGAPISLTKTCGECHEADWIEAHSYHSAFGSNRPYTDEDRPRPWDRFAGPWGRWSPLVYQRLSEPGDPRPDADLATWARLWGRRHVGGGPVRELAPEAEMNCLLCHSAKPNLEARARTIDAGEWRWQSTATLEGSGLVEATEAGWAYVPDAFLPDGAVSAARLGLHAASAQACGTCHGAAPAPGPTPVTLPHLDRARPSPGLTDGLVYSGQPMHLSGVNLAGKTELTRPWDIHAERMLSCSDCHGALNDPVHGSRDKKEQPAHLRAEVRGMALQDYLRRPDHDFATGRAAPGVLGAQHAGTMKRCEDCHDANQTHQWLPYPARHLQAMFCETCHVPRVHSPLIESVDWTVLTPERGPRTRYRGVTGAIDDPGTLISGFEPVLLPRATDGGATKVAPHNLVSAFYWVEGDPPTPVRLVDLEAAFFWEGDYTPGIVLVLDEDHDGRVGPDELRLDTEVKVAAVAAALEAVGVPSPRAVGEIQPYALSHQVAGHGFALKDCATCHSEGSRFTQPTRLAAQPPAGVVPGLVKDSPVPLAGDVVHEGGELRYVPTPAKAQLYLLGQGGNTVVDLAGWASVLLVLAGSILHGGARVMARRRPDDGEDRS